MKKILETLKNKWSEYLLEMIVIIMGILGAYALNNWKEYENDRTKEYELLSELKREITLNIEQLERVKKDHALTAMSTTSLLELFGNYDEKDTVNIDYLIFRSTYPSTFDPQLGVINSIISSGGLNMLRNKDIVSFIVSFEKSSIDTSQEFLRVLENWDINLMSQLYNYYHWNLNATIDSHLSIPTSPFESDFRGLFNDPKLWDFYVVQSFNLVNTVGEEELLLTDMRSILELVEAELETL